MPTLDDERFGVDIDLSGDPEAPIPVTPSGDLTLIRGRANLRAALARNCVVAPGELLHRPEYGGGLALAVETIGSPPARATVANRLRRALLADPRIRDASVGVSLDDDVILVEVAARVAGDQGAESFTLSYPT